MNEFELIDRFFARQRVHRDDVPLAIGDDAAVVRAPGGGELVVTTDVLVDGVHFPRDAGAADIGHKALAVNLSDVAAMGAIPAWATLGLTLPDVDEPWLAAFASSFFALAEEFEVQLIGGDLTRGPLSVAVQLTGFVDAAGYLSRSGAREGDLIYVSGTLGDAGAGLEVIEGRLEVPLADGDWFTSRLHRPTPRVALGRALLGHASAAIDVSDGLAADLGHLCAASGVGAEVDIADLPLSDAYRRALPQLGREPALGFGDDYELCFTAAPTHVPALQRLAAELGVPLSCVGRISGDSVTWRSDGQDCSVDRQGYQHF